MVEKFRKEYLISSNPHIKIIISFLPDVEYEMLCPSCEEVHILQKTYSGLFCQNNGICIDIGERDLDEKARLFSSELSEIMDRKISWD